MTRWSNSLRYIDLPPQVDFYLREAHDVWMDTAWLLQGNIPLLSPSPDLYLHPQFAGRVGSLFTKTVKNCFARVISGQVVRKISCNFSHPSIDRTLQWHCRIVGSSTDRDCIFPLKCWIATFTANSSERLMWRDIWDPLQMAETFPPTDRMFCHLWCYTFFMLL